MADKLIRHPGGRPPSDFDLPEGWRDNFRTMYINGASDAEVMVWIMSVRPSGKMSWDLWYRWQKDYIEFSEAIKEGKLMARAWFEKVGRENMANRGFNALLWTLQMRNRFQYVTKEPETDGDAEDKPKELGAPKINILPLKEDNPGA